MIATILLLLMFWLLAIPVMAQQSDEPTVETIGYDAVVDDSITDIAIFDWWSVIADEGDVMVIDMRAGGGLAPLIGLLDPNGDLVARSADGEVDGMVTLEYTIARTGEYRIVATRVGNENGTTTGPYQLQVRRANPPPEVREDPFRQAAFRCKDFEVSNAAVLEFIDDAALVSFYRITVYGLDGFSPVIRATITEQELTDCAQDSQAMDGDSYQLPGESAVTVTGDLLEFASQLTIRGAKDAGLIVLTIGSKDGAGGRYLAVIEGFSIDPEDDKDFLTINQGPLAGLTPLSLYMVAGENERLDPSMTLSEDQQNEGVVCDDAGRRGCEGVPSIDGLRVSVTVGQVEIAGDRFDAGVVFSQGSTEPRSIELSSFSENTRGAYSLIVIGELPPEE